MLDCAVRSAPVVQLTVLEMHLDCWAVGDLAHPYVEIFAFARLEEEDVVAVVQVGELAELVELGFGVELGVLFAVRHHRCQVIEEVAVSARRDGQVWNMGSASGRHAYLNVTPLDERMRTLCLFLFWPSVGASPFDPVALDRFLYTAAIASDLGYVLG